MELRPYQKECIEIIEKLEPGAYLIQMATGLGKCLAPGTAVLMYDGSIKPVEDIKIGEKVMGPDSMPRTVTSLAHGFEEMYEIIPIKGESYRVNKSHILSLKITNIGKKRVTSPIGTHRAGEIVNISVQDYLHASKNFKHVAKSYRVPINFSYKNVKIPPYILGIWLGDGSSREPMITSMDQEVIEEWRQYASILKLSVRISHNQLGNPAQNYHIFSRQNKSCKGSNKVRTDLRFYNLLQNKHIPKEYLHNSRFVRMELLAGLLDTDGYVIDGNVFEIATKYQQLCDDILYLARSLGFAAYARKKTIRGRLYYRINISGETHLIPTRVPRRQATPRKQKKDVLMTGIKITPCGVGEYYGFSLAESDRRFVLGDFTVTHNTVTFANIPRRGRLLILSHRDELVHQPLKYFDCPCGVEQANESSHGEEVVSASVMTLHRRLNKFQPDDFDIVIVDECHHSAAKTYRKIIDYFKPRLLLGFTATPARGDHVRLDDIYSAIIYQKDILWGIQNKWLCDINCLRVDIGYDIRRVKVRRGDYDLHQLSAALNQKKANEGIAEAYKKYAKGQTVIFAVSVEHAQNIAEYIDGAVVVSASTPNRQEILRKFMDKEIPCLVNCMILTEGTDLPLIETIIIARPTRNTTLYQQMTGRGLRLYPGKTELTLVDCVGTAEVNDLCTAPSLLGIDMSQVPEKKRDKITGKLTEMQAKVTMLVDMTPEAWILSYRQLNLFMQRNKYDDCGVRYNMSADGSMLCSLKQQMTISITPPDQLGMSRCIFKYIQNGQMITKHTDLVPLQTLFTKVRAFLDRNFDAQRYLWDKSLSNIWSNQPASDKQIEFINRLQEQHSDETDFSGFDPEKITKGEASIVIDRLKTMD